MSKHISFWHIDGADLGKQTNPGSRSIKRAKPLPVPKIDILEHFYTRNLIRRRQPESILWTLLVLRKGQFLAGTKTYFLLIHFYKGILIERAARARDSICCAFRFTPELTPNAHRSRSFPGTSLEPSELSRNFPGAFGAFKSLPMLSRSLPGAFLEHSRNLPGAFGAFPEPSRSFPGACTWHV